MINISTNLAILILIVRWCKFNYYESKTFVRADRCHSNGPQK